MIWGWFFSFFLFHGRSIKSQAQWGTGTLAPSRLPTISFLDRFGVNLSESQQSKYCAVCEISWCRCQQLTAISMSTALVTKLLVIEPLLRPALKSTVSAPWHIFYICPSSQQILATPLASLIASVVCSVYWGPLSSGPMYSFPIGPGKTVWVCCAKCL